MSAHIVLEAYEFTGLWDSMNIVSKNSGRNEIYYQVIIDELSKGIQVEMAI